MLRRVKKKGFSGLLLGRAGVMGLLTFLFWGGRACLAQGAVPAQGDDSLVLHYKFAAEQGAVAKDLSRYGNDGKIIDGQYLPEVNGRRDVLRLNGKTSFIDCGAPESLFFAGDMTLEMWVRLNQPLVIHGNEHPHIFGEYPTENWNLSFPFRHSLAMFYRSSINRIDSSWIPVDKYAINDQWAHFAVVMEYPRCRFYRNGKLIRDAYMPLPGIPKVRNIPKYIGGGSDQNFTPMDLTEFRFYKRALTAREIAAHAENREIPIPFEAELAVEPNWYENKVVLRYTTKGIAADGRKVDLKLADAAGKALLAESAALQETQPGSGRYSASASLPLYPLKNTTGLATGRLAGDSGAGVRKSVTFTKPAWVHSRAGLTTGVPAPWTPVKVRKLDAGIVKVGVWGRDQTFTPGSLVKGIRAAGAELLSSPASFSGRIDGQEIRWGSAPVQLNSASAQAARLQQGFRGGPVSLQVKTSVEFDGYTIFDCELKASKAVSLDGLKFELPLNSEHAQLCYGQLALPIKGDILDSEYYSGRVKGDLAFKFTPNVWLGDRERGISWQAESDKDWRYADPLKAIEILPRGKTTYFRANLVDVPMKLAAGQTLRYKFALQATPAKPIRKTSWQLRVARSEPFGADLLLPDKRMKGEPILRYWKDLGVRNLFTNVSDQWPWPMPDTAQFGRAYKRLVDSAHASGLRVHNYVIHQRFPVMRPEFDIYGLQLATRPMDQYMPDAGLPARPGPISTDFGANSQGTVFFCPKSQVAQDSYVEALAQRLKQFGDDGVYLDGTGQIVPCQNLEHGCGYRAADGTIHSTFPVFAVREFMKRIYVEVKKSKADGIVDQHMSWGHNPAALAYSDILWTGEQWYHLRNTGAGYISGALPLDRFQTEFMGTQFGVAADILCYRLGPPMKVAAISLLHDVSPRLSTDGFDKTQSRYDEYFALLPSIWKMRDSFGADQAKKLFYWNNANYVTVGPEKCYATLLQHPKNGVLAIVSNLDQAPRTVNMKLNLNALGLKGRTLTVTNALTKAPLALSGEGEVSLALESEQWAYLWIKPGK